MERETIRKQLLEMRKWMFQMDAEQKKGYKNAGEVMEVPVDGEPHKIRYYSAGDGIRPVYIDIHGGGMVWGSMENGDLLARMFNSELGIHVISLDYPLVPDTEYPQTMEYLYGTVRELVRHAKQYRLDKDKMVIGGRSAGGNLSAVMCVLAAQRGEFRFRGQILDHPWLDLCGLISWEGRPKDETMTQDVMRALAFGYADEAQQKEVTCTPLLASEELLTQLPPAIIQTCELDPLRVEGERYGQMLQSAGVQVRAFCFPNVPHGFSENNTEIGEAGRKALIDAVKEEWTWFADCE